MEAKELRLENLVYNTHMKLTKIEPCHFVEEDDLLRDRGDYVDLPVIRFFEPIPLSEEWLLRFGFRRLDKYTFSLNGWFIYNRKRGFVTGSKKRELNIQSVNQLQNWWYGNNLTELELQQID